MLNLFFPLTCIFCGNKTDQTLALCDGCEIDLPWITHSCLQCAIPLPASNNLELRCPACLQNPPPFERAFALFHYQHPISAIITQLKFYHQLLYAKLFGLLLAKYLQHAYEKDSSYPSIVIPMPLHKKRLRERGFNQALEIARPFSKNLQIPIDYKLSQRIRETKSQSSQRSVYARFINVKNAFSSTNMKGQHLLIIDDVITTGATVRELAKELNRQGASRVDVACCARTN